MPYLAGWIGDLIDEDALADLTVTKDSEVDGQGGIRLWSQSRVLGYIPDKS